MPLYNIFVPQLKLMLQKYFMLDKEPICLYLNEIRKLAIIRNRSLSVDQRDAYVLQIDQQINCICALLLKTEMAQAKQFNKLSRKAEETKQAKNARDHQSNLAIQKQRSQSSERLMSNL